MTDLALNADQIQILISLVLRDLGEHSNADDPILIAERLGLADALTSLEATYDDGLAYTITTAERQAAEAYRLARIAEIVEAVDHRCQAADGPVSRTLEEMTQDEISAIYALAKGKPEDWRPTTTRPRHEKTERTAAKTHWCLFCAGIIAAGDRYIDGFWIDDNGMAAPWNAHTDCQEFAETYPDGPDVPPFADWEPEFDCPTDAAKAERERLMARAVEQRRRHDEAGQGTAP